MSDAAEPGTGRGEPRNQLCNECGTDSVVVWETDEPLWNFVVAGQAETVMRVRPGSASGHLGIRAEGVGGLLCPECFTRKAAERGLHLDWRPRISWENR